MHSRSGLVRCKEGATCALDSKPAGVAGSCCRREGRRCTGEVETDFIVIYAYIVISKADRPKSSSTFLCGPNSTGDGAFSQAGSSQASPQ